MIKFSSTSSPSQYPGTSEKTSEGILLIGARLLFTDRTKPSSSNVSRSRTSTWKNSTRHVSSIRYLQFRFNFTSAWFMTVGILRCLGFNPLP